MNLAQTLTKNSDNRAVSDGGDIYSHEQLLTSSLKLTSGLIDDLDVKPGQRIALIANNSIEFLIAYIAVLSSGAIVIPLDPNEGESDRAREISLVKPNLIIASTKDWIPETYRDAIPSLEFHSRSWRNYLKKKPSKIIEREPNDVAVMMMTSGANFQPRPAMLTHGSMVTNLNQAMSVDDLKLKTSDVVLAALPMYHIFGLQVVVGLALASGASIVISRTFDPIEIANTIKSNEATIVPAVPVLFDAFIRNPTITIDSFSGVRLFVSGGAPMRSEVREKFHERFGFHVAEGYGLTEASPMVSFTANASREGEIGTPLPGVEVEIRDSDGAVALDGDVGQIVVRGENIFAGYFKEKEATSRVLDSNGWLFTGDIGVRSEDGTITLIDRSSDVIVVSGFSVFPSEVENVLIEHDRVEQASVVGELDEKSGEIVIAYVAIDSDKEEIEDPRFRRQIEKELRDFCSSRLARYKIPSRFEFIDELNVRASSRPLRKSLRSALRNIE